MRSLAEALEQHSGIEVVLDQFDTWAGMDLAHFMEEGLSADRIVMILTPGLRSEGERTPRRGWL